MNVTVSAEVLDLFPRLRIACISARSIDNKSPRPDLEPLMRESEEKLRKAMPDVPDLEADPRIVAWQETYRRFGTNPKRSRPSAEALLRRIIKGTTLRSVNTAVDAYIVSELEHLLPVGGYDASKIAGDIQLRLSPGDEPFVPIGATEAEKTVKGEVVYGDAERVLTRHWNHRDCDHAKITEDTTDLVLFVEAPDERITTDQARIQADRIAELLTRFCGGRVESRMLDGLAPGKPTPLPLFGA